MKRATPSLAIVLLFLSLLGCATAPWTYPYPEVPPGKPPEKRAWYAEGGFRHDAIQRNPKYKEVFARIDAEVDAAVQEHPQRGQFGFVHTRLETKRRILYWRYGIDWYPSTTMTPGVVVD